MLTRPRAQRYFLKALHSQWSAGSANVLLVLSRQLFKPRRYLCLEPIAHAFSDSNNIPLMAHHLCKTVFPRSRGSWISNSYTYKAFNLPATPTPTPTPTPVPTPTRPLRRRSLQHQQPLQLHRHSAPTPTPTPAPTATPLRRQQLLHPTPAPTPASNVSTPYIIPNGGTFRRAWVEFYCRTAGRPFTTRLMEQLRPRVRRFMAAANSP